MTKQNYYVLLVESGREDIIKQKIEDILEHSETILLPTRELYIKKCGKTTLKTTPLFSGYIFLQTDKITAELLIKLKQIKGFYKLLNSNQDIKPLNKNDIEQLGSFLKKGYKASVSNVTFNKDDKIVVTDGPLKEFEGRIVKVDKRKRRAKVQLTMYNNAHFIDFAFQDLESKL